MATDAMEQSGEAITAAASPQPVAVLFVCLGNICRSTMSEGVFQSLTHPANKPTHSLVSRIDSCGTGAYHIGSGPDSRTMATLVEKGITNYHHRARKFRTRHFQEFNYILAMDDDNLDDLMRLREKEVKRLGSEEGLGRVMLFGDFGGRMRRSGKGEQIDDPYYGDIDGFEIAYSQAVKFSKNFLEKLEAGMLS